MRPAVPSIVAWSVAVLGVLVLWSAEVPFPGTHRLDAQAPFTQLAALRVPLVVLAVVVACGWLVVVRLTRWVDGPEDRPLPAVPAGLLLLAALAAAGQIAPRVLGRGVPLPSGGTAVTVLSANVFASRATPETVAVLVRRTGARVVALPEANARTARAYAREVSTATGLRWVAFTDARGGPDDDRSARPTSMLVSAHLRPARLPAPPAGGPDSHGAVRVRLTLGRTRSVVVSAVHPLPPPPAASQAAWRRDLRALRRPCRDGELLAGDFNATLDHSPFRALLGAGCRDAASDVGRGLRATWTGGPLGIVRPAIDHVLTSGRWATTNAGVRPIPGSDHRAVWARVVVE
ncbi:endonuclease/exonuclease/phosphatase family protein [Patulibacter minatonensis]|uniref:endonuclease/exonuclease/phosphatase family protein n=1 Tax=Patulibacter minatonensis TaxID=298163 RepID=UPI0004788FE2|nr:endonuclease/exonuclease/phosphatase family protein [Patulibacter minatonensis]